MRLNLRELKKLLHERALAPGSSLARRLFKWLDEAVSDYTNVQAFGLWMAAIVVGFVSVMYAQAFRLVENFYEHLVPHGSAYPLIAGPLLFLLAWWLVYRFAPEASGSGIPQVMSVIETDYSSPNSRFVDRLLGMKTAGIKVVSSLLLLAGGGAIGREGPTLQISAAIFHLFGRGVRRYYGRADEHVWVIAGAAAGLASAFNTPLGGIVYAIEELGMKHFHRVRTALLTAVIISGLMAQTMIGSYLYLGFPRLQPLAASQWPVVILTGFVAGIAGGLFSRTLFWGVRKRQTIRKAWKLGAIAALCGLAAGIILYFEPLVHGPGAPMISKILFEGETATFTMIVQRTAATALAYFSGAAGGIFSPSLAIGATIGSKIAWLTGSANVNLLAMLGMIGFLTGVTHSPFTSFILVMEMSDRHSAIFPMMVTALIASSVTKSIQRKSFYEAVRDDMLARQNAQAEAAEKTQESSGDSKPPTPDTTQT